MSGRVNPATAHTFLLFVPSGVEPPAVPWADELSPDNPKAARWVRLDRECHGDGKVMPRELYALVCGASRDPNDVIHAFQNELALEESCDEAVLIVHRYAHDDVELYTKNGAPLLLAAARTTVIPSLVSGATSIAEIMKLELERRDPRK